jgi:VWFA-related protein
MRRVVWCVMFFLASSLGGLGLAGADTEEPGAPPSPPPEVPTFSVGVDVILVDAVVTDDQGQPVTGLTADDFVVREDGALQTITRFEAVDLEAGPEAGPAEPAPRLSTNEGGIADVAGRSFVVVMDDLGLSLDGAVAAREAVGQFLDQGTRPGDLVVLVVPGAGLTWAARVPEGLRRLDSILDSVEPRRSVLPEAMSGWEALQITEVRDPATFDTVRRRLDEANQLPRVPRLSMFTTPEEIELYEEASRKLQRPYIESEARRVLNDSRARRGRLFEAISSVLDGLGPGPGRKSVLLVSEGFVHEPGLASFRNLLTASRRTNAPVYYIDVRRLTSGMGADSRRQGDLSMASRLTHPEESTGAEVTAEETGGFALHNPNDVSAGAARISRESSHYYLLGYVSTRPEADGSYRRLEVEVRRPGQSVRARKGYFAPSDQAPISRPGEDPILQAALSSPVPAGEIPLRLQTFTLEPEEENRVRVVLAGEAGLRSVRFEEDADQSLVATLDLAMELNHVDPAGHMLVPWREWKVRIAAPQQGADIWAPVQVSFDLPAGPCQAKLVVRDRGSQAVGSVLHTFEVPAPGSARISTPILSDMPGEDASSRPRMSVSRSFASGTPLYCYFEVYAGESEQAVRRASFDYTVVDERGKSRQERPEEPLAFDADGTARHLEPMAREGLTPGAYELRLTVRGADGAPLKELREPFSVRRPPRPNLLVYTELLRTFLDGEVMRAMSEVLQWPPEDLEKLAASLPREDLPLRRAALLLHTALAFRLWGNARGLEADAQIAIGRAVLAEDAPPDLHQDWLLTVGYHQLSASSPAKALIFFQECTRRFPDAADGWLAAGMSYELAAFPDGLALSGIPVRDAAAEAERCYREAVRLAPRLAEARLRLGRVLRRSESWAAAERELAAAAETGEDGSLTAFAQLFWGELRDARGDLAGAIPHYRAALVADPGCQTAAFALSEALHRSGRFRDAAEVLAPVLATGRVADLSPWQAYHVGFGRQKALMTARHAGDTVETGARP